ncbi:glycosyltransferase [Myroides odoratimimus]|uniref:glycosyltransferase n=1 Tax=Myroides odoratimimus TaxID=76832 RepID=UPI00257682DB|nr:glycosyltransferase [Myroides odoratimimus]MDM1094748.1 glycosyltransferase [Myroides odoratimimus]
MKDTHILIFEHDIVKYPPILSTISFLLGANKKVILLGHCSDIQYLNSFKEQGVVFYSVIENDILENTYVKLYKYSVFKHKCDKVLKTFHKDSFKLWLFGEQCIWLLHKLVYKYDTNLYLFEIPSFSVSLRYRLLSLSLDYQKTLQQASKVVCCEYNRAHITKSFFNLKELPLVIPNKPSYDFANIDESLFDKYLEQSQGKKIILYQGIFNYPERKLDEFCEAIKLLPEEYILVLMGGDNEYKQQLKEKYSSERILFIPHISAPNHLSITRRAHIGILVYNGEGGNIENTLNTLYCAPNKVYEYTQFGIPMISNDVPALDYLFSSYNNGICISRLTDKSIKEAIEEIDSNYSVFRQNSYQFLDVVDCRESYLKLV